MTYFDLLVEHLQKLPNSIDVLRVLQDFKINHLLPETKVDHTMSIDKLISEILNVK